jgi:hypothetical protein
MDDTRLDYLPREDATPEGELAALAAVYSLVIQAHERNLAAPANERQKEVNSEERRQGQDQKTLAKGEQSCTTEFGSTQQSTSQ